MRLSTPGYPPFLRAIRWLNPLRIVISLYRETRRSRALAIHPTAETISVSDSHHFQGARDSFHPLSTAPSQPPEYTYQRTPSSNSSTQSTNNSHQHKPLSNRSSRRRTHHLLPLRPRTNRPPLRNPINSKQKPTPQPQRPITPHRLPRPRRQKRQLRSLHRRDGSVHILPEPFGAFGEGGE